MITIETPCIVHATDYHDFDYINNVLKATSQTSGILYKEFLSPECPPSKYYSAIFFVKGEAKKANKIIKQHEKILAEEMG